MLAAFAAACGSHGGRPGGSDSSILGAELLLGAEPGKSLQVILTCFRGGRTSLEDLVHLHGQYRTYGAEDIVAVQSPGHEPAERCLDWDWITHGNLVLDNSVDKGMIPRIGEGDVARGVISFDQVDAL